MLQLITIVCAVHLIILCVCFRCVPLRNCGCQYKGSYYPAASTFWGDNTCTTKCECLGGKAKVGVCGCVFPFRHLRHHDYYVLFLSLSL